MRPKPSLRPKPTKPSLRPRSAKPSLRPKPPAIPVKPPPIAVKAPPIAAKPPPVQPKPPPVELKQPPLPIVEPSRHQAPTPTSTADAKGARSILVVDDDEATRRLLVRALRTVYTVYEAEDGEAAANLLDQYPNIDALVTDIMMPHLSGTDLARKMKSDPRLKNVPILFVTAKKESADMIGFTSGARYFLRKPFKLKDLLERVESLFVRSDKR
jgi:CheY-like chemotaxis protein